MALDKFGDVDRQLGDLPSALRHYERALSVAESLASSRPDDRSARRGLVISVNKLGELHRRSGDLETASGRPEEARRWFGHALDLLGGLADRDRLPPSCDGWLGAIRDALADPSRPLEPPPAASPGPMIRGRPFRIDRGGRPSAAGSEVRRGIVSPPRSAN